MDSINHLHIQGLDHTVLNLIRVSIHLQVPQVDILEVGLLSLELRDLTVVHLMLVPLDKVDHQEDPTVDHQGDPMVDNLEYPMVGNLMDHLEDPMLDLLGDPTMVLQDHSASMDNMVSLDILVDPSREVLVDPSNLEFLHTMVLLLDHQDSILLDTEVYLHSEQLLCSC